MSEGFDRIVNAILSLFNLITSSIPKEYYPFFSIAIFTILITIYLLFVWQFNKFISKRDLLNLNLKKYNNSSHPGLKKTLAIFYFLLEYLIILPIIVFLWFLSMAIIFLIIAKDLEISQVILISGSIVGCIRLISYYNEDLAKDIAKLFPLSVLVVSLTTKDFFNISSTIEKIASIPLLVSNIAIYILFIAAIEFITRLVFLLLKYNE